MKPFVILMLLLAAAGAMWAAEPETFTYPLEGKKLPAKDTGPAWDLTFFSGPSRSVPPGEFRGFLADSYLAPATKTDGGRVAIYQCYPRLTFSIISPFGRQNDAFAAASAR